MPPIMIAQEELVVYSQFLEPLSREVLKELQELVQGNQRRYWYTVYMVLFVLLHSCSMIINRDGEYACQINLKVCRTFRLVRFNVVVHEELQIF